MKKWLSDTAHIRLATLENSRTGGSEVVDGVAQFQADRFLGMDNTVNINKYFDALAVYSPTVNTLRFPINAKSLNPDIPGSAEVTAALEQAVERGYQVILVYTDPVFHGSLRTGASRAEQDAYYLHNQSSVDGKTIELDDPVITGDDRSLILKWGAQSAPYDPVDYLRDGWGEVLDWLDAHPKVKARVYGYEMINEPGRVYTDHNNPLEMHAYAQDVIEVFQAHAGRWQSDLDGDGIFGNARILVDISGSGSGRVGALDEVVDGAALNGLDMIREAVGDALIWSIHLFRTTSLQEFSADQSRTEIYKLSEDDILITETQFDGDFQIVGDTEPHKMELAALYRAIDPSDPKFTGPDAILESGDYYTDGSFELAAWMGWELLDPIMGSRNYFFAREKPWYQQNGIGSGYWSPVGFDASPLVGFSGSNVETHRDIVAFANDLWTGQLDAPGDAFTGNGLNEVVQTVPGVFAGRDTITIGSEGVAINGKSHTPPMVAFGFGGDDTIIGSDSSSTEGGGRDFRQQGKQQLEGHSVQDKALPQTAGDMAYGGPGNDRIDLRGGDDFGFGNQGDDSLIGGTGSDVLLGGAGNDTIEGGPGDDAIEGGDGDDTLIGGPGRDLIKGDAGNDVLIGSDGEDYFYFDAAGDGQDTISGFEWGIDRIFIGNSEDFFGSAKRKVVEVDTAVAIDSYAYGKDSKIIFETKAPTLNPQERRFDGNPGGNGALKNGDAGSLMPHGTVKMGVALPFSEPAQMAGLLCMTAVLSTVLARAVWTRVFMK